VIPLQRPPLPVELAERLRQRHGRLHETDLSTASVRRAWKNARTEREGLRGALLTMAAGHARCMYCCDSTGTDIDHFEPIALAPLRAFDWLNHLLACSFCNSNQKRELYPCDAASGAGRRRAGRRSPPSARTPGSSWSGGGSTRSCSARTP